MKISCDSCGAKYTIADAKVQGRKVKVRCKSCKATILVDGNASGDAADDTALSEPPEAAPAAVAAAAAPMGGTPKPAGVRKDAWSVNLSDDDSRDLTTAEIIAGWKSGLVTQDAYAWKDGMADWKPILEIPELKQKLLASRPLKPEPVISSAKLPPSPGKTGGSTDDLFGGVDLAGSESDAAAHPARPAPKPAAGTGARNESSVLFSLDSLTGGGAGAAAPVAASPDIFGGLGGGGLLATNTDLLTAPAKEPPPAPVFKVPSVRPAMPGQQKSSMPLILGIVAALVVVGGVLFFVMGGKDEPSVDPAAAAMAAELEKTKAALKQSEAEEEAAKKKAEEAAKKAAEEAAKPAAVADPGKKPEDKPAETAAPATPSTSTSPSTTPSTGTPTAGTTPKPAAPSGGGAFDVGAAKAALAGAAAGAAGCGSAGGPKGSGKVQVTFAPSGRVTSANVVAGPFGGTSVGGCVASKFRAARVPAFNGSPQTVSKSFTVN